MKPTARMLDKSSNDHDSVLSVPAISIAPIRMCNEVGYPANGIYTAPEPV